MGERSSAKLKVQGSNPRRGGHRLVGAILSTDSSLSNTIRDVIVLLFSPLDGDGPSDLDISNIPCRVCGGRSSGFHFGALTCEGCKVSLPKSFFVGLSCSSTLL